jgi:hypothetical protein
MMKIGVMDGVKTMTIGVDGTIGDLGVTGDHGDLGDLGGIIDTIQLIQTIQPQISLNLQMMLPIRRTLQSKNEIFLN